MNLKNFIIFYRKFIWCLSNLFFITPLFTIATSISIKRSSLIPFIYYEVSTAK
ncbi:hypothetical protein GLOIN_2v1702217 [Rhizophagus irregularis DAOM 181602=DAOM 197198]|uniref:Uncharacterized protein n=1 Tax=Rhizophagus irregularis (strain DAOM 181602 / DAOM 197198 / MUCL 43194) TaxID=747089 RepID=A0A2P4P8G1_RHIID|nr:hypothetical protein GLOIN_2v1702217 [Rhizophagus irregularis DAOM 181602=DAOM 197198]POG61670.1 hypothetical protein GLOIN_2v1702217 [Rhizophagus irregularis DAOM 181602=DAOM 197198]|eukprot:XP_025168536.1 hypothetical protein GLOIN_2v1702217 [Rhizophagus irregularis DAOM 181602=DAOM 197198]